MIESVERRARRQAKTRREIADFRHALRFFAPYQALRWIRGMYATWHAVRRVAEELIQADCPDVMTAWGICRFVDNLPDGGFNVTVVLPLSANHQKGKQA